MRHIAICGLACSTVFFHITSQTARFSRGGGGGKLLKTKCVFLFSIKLLFEPFLIPRRTEQMWSKMYIGLHVKYRLLLLDFNETWICYTNFRKILKFLENPSSGSRVVPCGQTDGHDEATSRFSRFCERACKCHFIFWQFQVAIRTSILSYFVLFSNCIYYCTVLHLEAAGIDKMIILKWIFKRYNGDMDWIHLTQDRGKWLALLKTVMDLRVPYNVGHFQVTQRLSVCQKGLHSMELLPHASIFVRYFCRFHKGFWPSSSSHFLTILLTISSPTPLDGHTRTTNGILGAVHRLYQDVIYLQVVQSHRVSVNWMPFTSTRKGRP
jgi:hypothetical protein